MKSHKSKTGISNSLLFCLTQFCAVALSQSAFAMGDASVSSTSFFEQSKYRSTTTSYMKVGPKIQGENSIISANSDLHVYAFLDDPRNPGFQIKDLYLASSPQLSSLYQLKAGFHHAQWSEFDEEWNFGMWNPRFMWEPLHPDKAGMPGAFFDYSSKKVQVSAFATWTSMPELGAPMINEDGKLSSSSPWFTALPANAMISGAKTPIHYSLVYPNKDELFLRSAFAFRLRVGEKTGQWFSLSAGQLPIHTAALSISASLKPDGILDTKIYPWFQKRIVTTLETGYTAEDKTGMWLSFSYDRPIDPPTFSDDILAATENKPQLIGAFGANILPTENFRLKPSILIGAELDGEVPTITNTSGSGDSLKTSLPNRYPYQEALKLEAEARLRHDFKVNGAVTTDLKELNSLVSLDATFSPGWIKMTDSGAGMSFSAGSDVIFYKSKLGFIGQYAGNENVHGQVSFEF